MTYLNTTQNTLLGYNGTKEWIATGGSERLGNGKNSLLRRTDMVLEYIKGLCFIVPLLTVVVFITIVTS